MKRLQERLKAGFDRLTKKLKKQITSLPKRFIAETARESFMMTDSSMCTSTVQGGQDATRHGRQDSQLWSGLVRAVMPDIEKIGVTIMGGAGAAEFVKKMCTRFGRDKLLKGSGHIKEYENIYLQRRTPLDRLKLILWRVWVYQAH